MGGQHSRARHNICSSAALRLRKVVSHHPERPWRIEKKIAVTSVRNIFHEQVNYEISQLLIYFV